MLPVVRGHKVAKVSRLKVLDSKNMCESNMSILPCLDEKTKAILKFVEGCTDRLKDLSQYEHDLLTQRHKTHSIYQEKYLIPKNNYIPESNATKNTIHKNKMQKCHSVFKLSTLFPQPLTISIHSNY